MSAATPTPSAAPAAPVDLPLEKTLTNAAKLAIAQDKPILLDYYKETRAGTAFLGEEKDSKEQILFKNADEYTSPIQNKYRVQDATGTKTEYIFVTENSIYIVHGAIKKKEISTVF